MPDNIVNSRIKLASKSATDWSTANPTLLDGEVGLDSTNKIIKVGDGITAWNDLERWNPDNYVTLDTVQNIDAKKTFIKQTDDGQEVIENALELSSDTVIFRYTPLSYTGHYKPSNSTLEFNSSSGGIDISNTKDEFLGYDNPQLTTRYISHLSENGLNFNNTYYSNSTGKRTNTINSFIQNSSLQFLKQERNVYDVSDGTTKTANYQSILNISDGLYLQHNYDYSQSTPLTTDTAQLKDTFLSFTHGPTNLLKTSLDYNGFSIFEQGSDSSKLFQITRDSTDGTLIQGSDTTDTTLHIPSGGNGMGIGMKAQASDNTLYVGYDAKFYGDIIKHDAINNIDIDLVNAFEPIVAYGTNITTNSNLNTSTYVNVGLYYRADNATVATFSNCPTTVGFSMIVRNVNKTDVNSSAKTWQYLTREITDINGNQFIQTAFCGSTVGTWVFGEWKKIIVGRKTGTLTANVGSFDEAYCRQSGDTVDIHGWLVGLSTSDSSHANAITVSGVSLPSVPIRFVFTCWLNNGIASYAGYGVLDTYGNITFVKPIANANKVSFTITYVV